MLSFKSLRLGFTVLIVTASAGIAQAAFLPGYSGNSQFINPHASSDGVVNFGVYANTDGDWTNDFGLPANTIQQLFELSPGPSVIGNGIDSAANFVYFYQIVNTDPDPATDATLKELEINLPEGTSLVTSAGYLDGHVFDDPTDATLPAGPDGATGPTGNARLGTDPDTTPDPDDVDGDGAPSESGVVLTGFAAIGGAINPNWAEEADPFTLQFIFVPSVIPTGSYSSVFFLTSNVGPDYLPAQLEDTDDTNADIPVPNPELGTFAMTISAFACALGAVIAARRKV